MTALVFGWLAFNWAGAPALAATDAPPAAEAVSVVPVEEAPYVPTPENLAARRWFQDARFGIFIHWGTYSVLSRGEWVMNNERITVAEYEKLPPRFDPEKFNAAEWVVAFKRAGAKYITITSKHHDGFAMWDSQVSDWDIVDRTPYKRDVLKQLADECDRQGLKLFFYYSQLDWHHGDYFPRGRTGHTAGRPESGQWDKYITYMDAQLRELLSGKYGPIGGIWFDGWWDQQTKQFDATKDADPLASRVDWHLRRTYDLIHRLQPACLVGSNHHVRPFPGEDFQMFERDLPGENQAGFNRDSAIGQLPLETCDTINGAWGYNAGDTKFKPVPELVRYLVRAAGRDANLLLNVGPRPDGTLDPESVERLAGIGQWLDKYGESIYGTRGGPIAPQPWGVTTHTADAIYLHILDTSKKDSDGWLTLSGTEGLDPGGARLVTGGLTGELVKVDAASGGALKTKLANFLGSEPADVIWRLAK